MHDYLRLLFARVGRTVCRGCGEEVVRETAEVAARRLAALPEGARLLIGFDVPIASRAASAAGAEETASVAAAGEAAAGRRSGRRRSEAAGASRGRAAEAGARGGRAARAKTVMDGADPVAGALEVLRRKGFGRLLLDGRAVSFDDLDPERLGGRSTLQVIVDRVVVGPDVLTRLTDSIETGYAEGGGTAFAVELPGRGAPAADGEPTLHEFSERFECRTCRIEYEVPQPRLFSFNSPFGACPTCHGFGNVIELDMGLVVPDPSKSIQQDAIEPWSKPHYRSYLAGLKKAARARGTRLNVPWSELTDEERRFVIEGDGSYRGIQGFFRWLEGKKYIMHIRVFLSRYRGYLTCPDCGGGRLRPEARDVRVGGRTIDEVCALTVAEARDFFEDLPLTAKEAEIVDRITREIRKRLSFLGDVGLDYLTLDRLSSTLSGGESQRINLATALGSALVGTLYVLDEPSVGLHPRDNQRLMRILARLRDQQNTVLVVEHDADMIRAADHVVDLGLGAGTSGGPRGLLRPRRRAGPGADVADREVPAWRSGDSRPRGAAQAGAGDAGGTRAGGRPSTTCATSMSRSRSTC